MGYAKEYPCTMPAEIGGTLWGLSDFWGLIPYTVDRPFHCIAGSKESGCYEGRNFSAEDIGKSLFYTKEDYQKCEQKSIDIFRLLSESDKALGRFQGKIVAACKMWIEKHSYTCSYKQAERRLRRVLGMSRKKFKKLLNCELEVTMDELLNIADILGMPINLDFIEGIVNETK